MLALISQSDALAMISADDFLDSCFLDSCSVQAGLSATLAGKLSLLPQQVSASVRLTSATDRVSIGIGSVFKQEQAELTEQVFARL